jgi:hypothetical protein
VFEDVAYGGFKIILYHRCFFALFIPQSVNRISPGCFIGLIYYGAKSDQQR